MQMTLMHPLVVYRWMIQMEMMRTHRVVLLAARALLVLCRHRLVPPALGILEQQPPVADGLDNLLGRRVGLLPLQDAALRKPKELEGGEGLRQQQSLPLSLQA